MIPSINSKRILIVDDETNIRLVLRAALKSEGYAIEEATNGREALASIDRRTPDLMILDLSMPELDGLGVLRELKTVHPSRKPRTIVLTAYGSIPTAVAATRLGALDFLEKPVSPDEVRESVEAALNETLPETVPASTDSLSGGYAGVLDRVRKNLRLAQYTDAETLLMKAADLSLKDAAYFNLLGVLYEARRQWRLAKKFYGKSLKEDGDYAPAQHNLRRIYELTQFGSTTTGIQLGDEPDILFASLMKKHS
jgi:DNA-binding response OmpR family regulator